MDQLENFAREPDQEGGVVPDHVSAGHQRLDEAGRGVFGGADGGTELGEVEAVGELAEFF